MVNLAQKIFVKVSEINLILLDLKKLIFQIIFFSSIISFLIFYN